MLKRLSHDLKSPISANMGLAELWLMRLKEGDAAIDRKELIEDLDIFLAANRDMLQLLNNSMAVMRLEAGREPIEAYWESALDDILRRMGEAFLQQAASAQIDLQIAVPPGLPPVCWDVRKIRVHVVDHLLANALKFTAPGGRVRLSAVQESRAIVIRVADNGRDIPAAERQKIFHRRERLNVTSERVFRGEGLGLYGANLFVRQHGGTMTIEDGLDAHGVTFQVAMPIRPRRPHKSATAA